MNHFRPKLEVLSRGQRDLWNDFQDVPDFLTLYGDAATALRLGHRPVERFEFLTGLNFSPDDLRGEIPWLKDATVKEEGRNRLTVAVEREGESIEVSFFGGQELARVEEPEECRTNNVKVAGMLDVAATKVIEMREHSESNDYVDLAYMIGAGWPLVLILGAAAAIAHWECSPEKDIERFVRIGDGEEAKRFIAQEAAQIRKVPLVPLQAVVMTPGHETPPPVVTATAETQAVAEAER